MSKNRIRPLTADEVSYFCYQTAMILDSGVPIYDGLTVITSEMEEHSPEAAQLLKAITDSLSMEKPFYEALDETGAFPRYCVKAVMAGEMSGKLDEALKELSEYYEREYQLGEKMRGAVVSPLIMLAVTAVVIAVLTIKVLPMFAQIFSDFDPEIYSVINRSVKISSVAGTVMLIICTVLLLLSGLVIIIWKSKKEAAAYGLVSLLPFTKETSQTIASAQFANAVSMMINSGIAPAEALCNVKGISSDKQMNDRIDRCAELVMNDVPFSEALEQSELLPVFYSRTLRISYGSGSFDSAWQKISTRLTREAEARIDRILNSAEPVLTVILTVAAGVMMLTVLIPMMNIMTNI